MITERTTNFYRLLRPRWYLLLLVFGILGLVEVANDYVHLDRPVFSLAAIGLLVSVLFVRAVSLPSPHPTHPPSQHPNTATY